MILRKLAGTFAPLEPQGAESCPRSPQIVAASSSRQGNSAPIGPQSAFGDERHEPLQLVPLLQDDVSRSLLEALPDALLIVNSDGQIVLANSLAEMLFGYEHHALLGVAVALEILAVRRAGVLERVVHIGHRAAKP